MLFQTNESLEERIINALCSKSNVTAPWLLKKTAYQTQPYTKQALYKELRKLQREGIVVKAGQRFSLSFSWVLQFLNLAQQLSDTYLSNFDLLSIIPAPRQKKTWYFSNLKTMDHFWVHVIIAMFQSSKSKIMFQWLPHPWFDLLHQQLEERFQKALRIAKGKLYMIIGGEDYLDRRYTRKIKSAFCEVSHSQSPFHGQQDKYIQVTDDYILSIHFKEKTVSQIDEIFSKAKSVRDIEVARALELFLGKTRIRMTLEHNPRKARSYQGKFRRYFGVVKVKRSK